MRQERYTYICYAEEDREYAERLYKTLNEKGYDIWIDTKENLFAKNEKIVKTKAINNSYRFLLLLSKNSTTTKGIFQQEIKIALDKQKNMPENDVFIIPVRIEECDISHQELAEMKTIDLFPEANYIKGIMAIFETIYNKSKFSNEFKIQDQFFKAKYDNKIETGRLKYYQYIIVVSISIILVGLYFVFFDKYESPKYINTHLSKWEGLWQGEAKDISVETEKNRLDSVSHTNQKLKFEVKINDDRLKFYGDISFAIVDNNSEEYVTGKIMGSSFPIKEIKHNTSYMSISYRIEGENYNTCGAALLHLTNLGTKIEGYYLSHRDFGDYKKAFGSFIFHRIE